MIGVGAVARRTATVRPGGSPGARGMRLLFHRWKLCRWAGEGEVLGGGRSQGLKGQELAQMQRPRRVLVPMHGLEHSTGYQYVCFLPSPGALLEWRDAAALAARGLPAARARDVHLRL